MPQNSSRKLPVGLIAVTLLIIAAAVYFLFFYSSKKKTADTPSVPVDTTTVTAVVDTAKATDPFDVPKEVLFTGKREKDDYPGPLYPRFFPIGWSADGKFAYVNEPVDEACGCYFFNLYIIDLNTSDTSWQWKTELNDDNGEYEAEKGNDYHLRKVWEKNKALFSAKLNEAGIKATNYTALDHLPYSPNQNKYDFTLQNKTIQSEDYGMKMLASTEIYPVVGGVKGQKIFTEKHTMDFGDMKDYTSAISNKIYGFLKSPFSKQIALFYTTEHRGYEGPPNVIGYSMIGFTPGSTKNP